MPNIIDILARALSLRQETALNSITPNRAGGIMYDTLLVLNQMQLEGGSLLISKVYASVSAMEADTTPTSDLTGRALKPGQLVVIVTSDTSSSDMGSEYRYNGPGSWTYVGKVGGLPLDTVPTQSSTKGITSGGVYAALSAMKAEGYKYMGIATPGSGGTAPGTPNQPVFYIAGPGSYPNFGSITVASGYLGFIKYSGGSWTVESVAVGKDYDAQISALDGQITQLEAKVDELEDGYIVPSYTLIDGGITTSGGVGTGTTYQHTSAIPVLKGQKVKVSTAGYAFALISRDENGTYTPQMNISTGDANVPATYIWTAPEDMNISVSVKTTIAYSIGIESDFLQRIGSLETKVGDYDDMIFRLLQDNFGGVENEADFDNFDSSDVTYNSISGNADYTLTFNGNEFSANHTINGNGLFAIDLSKLNLESGKKYLICVKRSGPNANSYSERIQIAKDVSSSSVGNLVVTLSVGTYYQYAVFVASDNRFLLCGQSYNENPANYECYFYKITDIQALIDQVKENSEELEIVPQNTLQLEKGLGLGENKADFSGYDNTDLIFIMSNKIVSFDGNKIKSEQPAVAGNGYVAIDIDGLSLDAGERYFIRIYPKTPYTLETDGLAIRTGTTSSYIGESIADFDVSGNGEYFEASFVAESGLTLVFYQTYLQTVIDYSCYICREYGIPLDLTEIKQRENYANKMSWTPMDEAASGTISTNVTVTKVDNGADITKEVAGNVGCKFLLPQLEEGHAYTLFIECATLNSTPYITNIESGAHRYDFTANGDGTFTLVWAEYHQYFFPLTLRLSLKYNITDHEVRFYITDNSVPEERQVVKNPALSGIDEQNFSDALLKRCDYLKDNPTLYKGMDIVAFNKGICIGDSLTYGSMNTTDAQGNAGPALQSLLGSAFVEARSYPAKLAKLTGIEITTVAQGGITSYDFYETFKDQDWSGHEFAIIELGRNDVAQPPVGYGTWTEQSVTGFTNIINKLKTENPGIKIFVCNDTNIVGNKEIWSLINGIEQLVADLDDPDVILLDMHKYSTLNSTNAYQCAHLTQYGYYRLAQDYCNYISWYMATHKEEFRFIQFIGTNYVYTKEF